MYDFDSFFVEVAESLGITEWYELFDSSNFRLVEDAIAKAYGVEALDSDAYQSWVQEMAEDL